MTGTSGTARATACQREYTDADIAAALTRGGAKSPLCCSIQRAPTALRDGWPAMGKEKKRKRPVDVGGQAAQETASPDACDVGRDGGFTVQVCNRAQRPGFSKSTPVMQAITPHASLALDARS